MVLLSQTFCYWDKQQSPDSNIIQLHLTLKCTEDQSSHFCDCFLVLKWVFQHYDRGLTKFYAGSEQPLVCVVVVSLPNRQKQQHSLSCIWEMLNAGLRVSKSFEILLAESYLLHMSRVVRRPVYHRSCRYFTANLAEAGKRPVFWKSASEAGSVKIICPNFKKN